MQILEVYKLAEWYEYAVENIGILDNYSDLHIAVEKNVANSIKTPFEKEKKELIDNLRAIDFNVLTLEQIELLDRMKVYSLLGEQGEKNLVQVFNDNGVDIASISEHLRDYAETLSAAKEYFCDIKNNIKEYFPVDAIEELNDGQHIIRVYFKDNAAITSLEDFKDYGRKWYDIGRCIAIATETAPEDIKVIGAEKGSIIINLVTTTLVVGLISKVILEVLKVTQRFLDIKKTLLDIENLKLNNKKIEEDLKEELESEKEAGIDSIVETIAKEYNIESDGEKRNNLKIAIKLLLEFSDDGGKLDFVHNDLSEEEEDGQEDSVSKQFRQEIEILDSNLAEIRKLENSIKLLSNNLDKGNQSNK